MRWRTSRSIPTHLIAHESRALLPRVTTSSPKPLTSSRHAHCFTAKSAAARNTPLTLSYTECLPSHQPYTSLPLYLNHIPPIPYHLSYPHSTSPLSLVCSQTLYSLRACSINLSPQHSTNPLTTYNLVSLSLPQILRYLTPTDTLSQKLTTPKASSLLHLFIIKTHHISAES